MRYIQWLYVCIIIPVTWPDFHAYGQNSYSSNTTLINAFYSGIDTPVFWFHSGYERNYLRKEIQTIVDSVQYYGLQKENYNFPRDVVTGVSAQELLYADRQYTTALIHLASDLYSGADINSYIKNDEVSVLYRKQCDSALLSWLLNIKSSTDIHKYFSSLEPADSPYLCLKRELRAQIDSGNKRKVTQLNEAINLYRWISHFRFSKYIVVNIPSATLTLFQKDTEQLKMKIVVGKPSTRTPRFSTWCNKVVLYPYWNVPGSIARKELLPLFKRSPSRVDAMNMQILDRKGKIVDPYTLPWSSFNRNYFPYAVRQCTGCENALGVIKFNLTDPFNVYMHDTNYKLAFLSAQRYLSHGCIRVSKPIELGNALLDNKLDSNFLRACYKNIDPVEINLKKMIPVFVVYHTAVANADSVKYYRDIYHLLK